MRFFLYFFFKLFYLIFIIEPRDFFPRGNDSVSKPLTFTLMFVANEVKRNECRFCSTGLIAEAARTEAGWRLLGWRPVVVLGGRSDATLAQQPHILILHSLVKKRTNKENYFALSPVFSIRYVKTFFSQFHLAAPS